jgi:CheY-like chemotaxis protein
MADEIAEDELTRRLRQTHQIEEAGGIAHDLNNQVAIVTMGCDLLRRRLGEGDPARAVVDDIAAAADRAGELTRRLLAFSRAEAAPETDEAPPCTDASQGSETILVVEDQPRLRDVLCLVLKSFGYAVLAARDGADALQIAEGHPGPIHLLLADVAMPRTSGPRLAGQILTIRPAVSVVFMSGYAAEEMERHGGLETVTMWGTPIPPGSALLKKPFGPDELARVVRAALSSGSSRA